MGSYSQSAESGRLRLVLNTLAFAMKGFKIMLNSCKNPIIQKIFEISLILKMTRIFKRKLVYTVD